MPYISGTKFNFETRLHQLSASGSDLLNFYIEGLNYTGIGTGSFSTGEKYKVNREFVHKFREISGFYHTGLYIP